MLSVGQRLRGYEILKPLTTGGMATLYLARRHGAAGFTKLVAIKAIHPHLVAEDEAFVRMFLDEALLCARIEHPNVVHVEELGEENGTYFLAMEFVHGVSLSQLLKGLEKQKRALSPGTAVNIAIAVADGLHAAHEVTDDDGRPLGVVHRDVSPQNVLVDHRGFVKLIDFGIAKSRARTSETTGGQLKGKFRYMAPEQVAGLVVDRRTDIFALGVVLWEMLTMRRFNAATTEIRILAQALNPRRDPPSLFNPAVPKDVDEVVMRALACERRDRPATAAELRDQLVDALPESTHVSSSSLGGLTQELFGKDLRHRIEDLPESVSKLLYGGSPRGAREQFVMELTVPAVPTGAQGLESISAGETSETVSLDSGQASAAPRRRLRLGLLVGASVLLVFGGVVVALGGFFGTVARNVDASPPGERTANEPPAPSQTPDARGHAKAVSLSSPTLQVSEGGEASDAMVGRDASSIDSRGRDGGDEASRDRRDRHGKRQRNRAAKAPAEPSDPSIPVEKAGPAMIHGAPLVEDVPF